MEGKVNFTEKNLSLNLTPMWRQESKRFKGESNTSKSFTQSPSQKKCLRANELDAYKDKLLRGFKQSPIVNAYKNIDDFYKNIRPVKSKENKNLVNDSSLKEKYDPMLSFYSKKSDENCTLSEVVGIKQLELLIELINEESIVRESELYQSALKCLSEKISPIFHKRKMNNLKNAALTKKDDKPYEHFIENLTEILNEKKAERLIEKK